MGTQARFVFNEGGEFEACRSAVRFLESRGFSVGRMQGHDPRGILLGDFDIQRWRNLRPSDREALHGVMTGSMRNGPVTVRIFGTAPPEVRQAISGEPALAGAEA